MTLYKWSQTASADATADNTINWAEGQAPSSVNDSARAMMAATAKYRDDIAGAIVTTGTNTSYAVSSYQGFDALAHLNGQMIAFTPHATNGISGSLGIGLNVDSLGTKPLRLSPGVECQPGTIIQGTPYVAVYNNSDGAFYLQGFYGNPYNVPLGAGLDYWGPTAPNSAFAFPSGQAISRTTYAALFSMIGTTYGTGDGSTTFNLPDKRGRVSACTDDMGGSSAFRLTTSFFGATAHPGAVGGSESHTLTLGELPTGITSNGSNGISVTSSVGGIPFNTQYSAAAGSGALNVPWWSNANTPSAITSTGTNSISVSTNNTSGSAHAIVQPTIICNYIMRIL
jgi:microcystin-dependent protein